MNSRTTRSWIEGLAGSVLLTLGMSACDPDEDLFVMSQMRQVQSDQDGVLEPGEGPMGFTCQDISSGSGGAGLGSTADDFWMQESSREDEGLTVVIGSFEEELERRFYGREFIEAAEVDQFTVTTASGAQYEFVYWGARTCESTPPLP